MSDEFIPYARQMIDESDVYEVSQALLANIITRGPLVEQFEEAVAAFCEAKYAVAFSSGTAAMIAACDAAEVGPNDRYLTTPNTFIATAAAGIHARANPIFIDIERETGNIDLDMLENNINLPSSRGRTIVAPVHFSGISVDMERLGSMIASPDTLVIEDAAHAFGSCYKDGQKVGSCAWSQMTMFSFHPAKTITTGEGGMITTNDPALCQRLKRFRNNGIERDPQLLRGEADPWYYEVLQLTNNYNFTEMQAALGLSQFRRLDAFKEKRQQLVAAYREGLKDFPHLKLFTDRFDAHTVFHIFVVQIDFTALKITKKEVVERLRAKNIGTQVHYIPLYKHPAIRDRVGDIAEYFPQMEAYYAEALSLPLYVSLTEQQVEYIIKSLREILYV